MHTVMGFSSNSRILHRHRQFNLLLALIEGRFYHAQEKPRSYSLSMETAYVDSQPYCSSNPLSMQFVSRLGNDLIATRYSISLEAAL